MYILYSSGVTTGDQGGLAAGLDHFRRSCGARTSSTVIQLLCVNISSTFTMKGPNVKSLCSLIF